MQKPVFLEKIKKNMSICCLLKVFSQSAKHQFSTIMLSMLVKISKEDILKYFFWNTFLCSQKIVFDISCKWSCIKCQTLFSAKNITNLWSAQKVPNVSEHLYIALPYMDMVAILVNGSQIAKSHFTTSSKYLWLQRRRYYIRPNYHTVCLDFSKLLEKFVLKYVSTYTLTSTTLWTFSADDKLMIFSKETICMKCQILFSGKNKKNISKWCLLKILPRVLRVKKDQQRTYPANMYIWDPYGQNLGIYPIWVLYGPHIGFIAHLRPT